MRLRSLGLGLVAFSLSAAAAPGQGYVRGWVDAHGGCRQADVGAYGGMGAPVVLGKPAQDWTEADLQDWIYMHAICAYVRYDAAARDGAPWEAIPAQLREAAVRAGGTLRQYTLAPAIAEKEACLQREEGALRFAEAQAQAKLAEAEAQARAQTAAAARQVEDDAAQAEQGRRAAEAARTRQEAMVEQARQHAQAEQVMAAAIERQAEAEEAALAEAKRIAAVGASARQAAEARLAKVRGEAGAAATPPSPGAEASAGSALPAPVYSPLSSPAPSSSASVRPTLPSAPTRPLADRVMSLDDFRLDYDKLIGQTVTLEGRLMLQGETLLLMPGLYAGLVNTDFLPLDWDRLPREERKQLLDRCRDLGCPARVTGRAMDVLFGKGLRVEAVVLK